MSVLTNLVIISIILIVVVISIIIINTFLNTKNYKLGTTDSYTYKLNN